MVDNLIPKADNTSEIIRTNLLKNTYISKRHALRKNILPSKYRNNIKSATKQFENEQADLLANVNNVLQKTNLKQDYRNQVDIFNLYKKNIQAESNRKYLRKILFDLNKEILCELQKNDDSQKKINHAALKDVEKQAFIDDMEKQLIQKNNTFNKEMKELGILRQTLDGLLKKISVKNITYDSIVSQLDNATKYTTSIGKSAKYYRRKKVKALKNIAMFRNTNSLEARRWDLQLYAANDKLKSDLELSEYLQKKRSERRNNHDTSTAVCIEEIFKNEDLSKSMKHLVHISGETDLEIIAENIEKLSYDKDSLFHLIMFIEKQLTELELSIKCNINIGVEKKESIHNKQEINDHQLRTLFTNVQNNKDMIKLYQKILKDTSAEYTRLTDNIHSIFKMFCINPSTFENLELTEPPNEENMLNYFKEMEKQSFEILFKLNGIESGCLSESNEDTLTSDVESTQNLLTKDYNGIEIKLNKVLNIAGNDSIVRTPHHNIDAGYFPPA